MYNGLSQHQLTEQYSPSSCVDDINVYIDAYIKQSKKAKEQAIEDKLVLTDLKYASSNDTRLDLYLPKNHQHNKTQKRKLQVYIHGGYWQELSKEESCFAALNFQAHDYYFAVLNYSLAPNTSLTGIVEQVRQAIAWLYSHAATYGYDKDEIYLSGSSAGAHLAIMMLNTDWTYYLNVTQEQTKLSPVKGICAVSGIYDLSPIVQTYINEPLLLTSSEVLNNSPLLFNMANADETPCKLIICYGENETSEFKRQSQAFTDKLMALGYQVACHEIIGRNHFDVILDLCHPSSWLFTQVLKQME
ncbi:alpha/beta hydrolase [Thalassotalea piscium]